MNGFSDQPGAKLTRELFAEVQPVLKGIFEHPFNLELAEGTLSRERFCFYMQQDSLYLVHFARALALTGARFAREDQITLLLTAAQNALLAERSLHVRYFAEYGVTREMRENTRENPACLGYTSYILAVASLESLGESLAALLPCFWIYREVGSRVARASAGTLSGNPYRGWIEMYSDKEFSDGVDRFVDLTDAVAAQASKGERARMKDRFMTASRFEYHFWDDAYHMKNMKD